MNILQQLISDIPDPVFIVNAKSRKIFMANEQATGGKLEITGKLFEEVVHSLSQKPYQNYGFFSNRWFIVNQETLVWEKNSYHKMILKQRASVPAPEIIQALQDETAVLLHHLRSPLTGIQGYMDLLGKDLTLPPVSRLMTIWKKGINQLFEIMDELETLHNIPLDLVKGEQFSADINMVLNEILSNLDPEVRRRIIINNPADLKTIHCRPFSLNRILSILIENALEHPSEQKEIEISIGDQSITVSNPGPAIPSEIASRVFFPFVTTKVNNLGLGLTKAILYARQFGGTLFLTENSSETISFTLCLPPVSSAQ